jgi:hypothetical protein
VTRNSDRETDELARALQHLRLALISLDAANEARAAPYAQMAIDILEGWGRDDPSPPIDD